MGLSPFQTSSLIQGGDDRLGEVAGGEGPGGDSSNGSGIRASVDVGVRGTEGVEAIVRLDRPVKSIPSPVTSRLVKVSVT